MRNIVFINFNAFLGKFLLIFVNAILYFFDYSFVNLNCSDHNFVFQVGPNYKEDKELILYPNKGGKVSDILEEAAKVVELSPDGSGR